MKRKKKTELLPAQVTSNLLNLAQRSDILICSEIHGTKEVPTIVRELLDQLNNSNYKMLALEIPYDQEKALIEYALDRSKTAPHILTRPQNDGRGNFDMLLLVEKALSLGWDICAFDVVINNADEIPLRDRTMAKTLSERIDKLAPFEKALIITGNIHGQMTRKHDSQNQPLSCAEYLVEQNPFRKVSSVDFVFHQGSYYNNGFKTLSGAPIDAAYIETTPHNGKYSLALHLPTATPAQMLTKISN